MHFFACPAFQVNKKWWSLECVSFAREHIVLNRWICIQQCASKVLLVAGVEFAAMSSTRCLLRFILLWTAGGTCLQYCAPSLLWLPLRFGGCQRGVCGTKGTNPGTSMKKLTIHAKRGTLGNVRQAHLCWVLEHGDISQQSPETWIWRPFLRCCCGPNISHF